MSAHSVGIDVFALTFQVGVSDFITVTVRVRLLLPRQQANRALQSQLRSFLLNDDDANVSANMLPYIYNVILITSCIKSDYMVICNKVPSLCHQHAC
jgi:hypothetical protein